MLTRYFIGHKELALEVSTDPEQRFELALSLQKLHIAAEIADSLQSEPKWRSLGDAALSGWDVSWMVGVSDL